MFSDFIMVTVLQRVVEFPECSYIAFSVVNSCYRTVFQEKLHSILAHRYIKI